jgi:hypothetical protein
MLYSNFPVHCYNPFPCLTKVLFEDDPPLEPLEIVKEIYTLFPLIMFLFIVVTVVAVHLLLIWASGLSWETMVPPTGIGDLAGGALASRVYKGYSTVSE